MDRKDRKRKLSLLGFKQRVRWLLERTGGKGDEDQRGRLAAKAGVSPEIIRTWLAHRGKQGYPSAKSLALLAERLRISPNWLLLNHGPESVDAALGAWDAKTEFRREIIEALIAEGTFTPEEVRGGVKSADFIFDRVLGLSRTDVEEWKAYSPFLDPEVLKEARERQATESKAVLSGFEVLKLMGAASKRAQDKKG